MTAERSTLPPSPDDEHIKAFVDGRMVPDEAAEFARKMAADPQLEAQVILVRGLRRAASSTRNPAEIEAGWTSLERALDDERTVHRLVPRLARLPAWSIGAAAGLAAGFVLSLVVVSDVMFPGQGYEVAAGPESRAFVAQVAFAPNATEASLRHALLAANAQIIDGPSALGLYRLAFRDEQALVDGIAGLRARTDLVETIERIGHIKAE